MWRHFAGRDFPLEGFCKRLFPAEGFELGGISPHSQFRVSFYIFFTLISKMALRVLPIFEQQEVEILFQW